MRSREHCFHQQAEEQVVGLARQDAGLEITNDPKTGSGHRCSRSNLPYNHRASRSINLLHRLPVHHHRGATVVWETKPTTASVELDPSDGKNRGRTPPPDKEMRRLEKKLQSTFDVSGSDL